MPTPADQIPGGMTELARQVADLKRQVGELRAARRLGASGIGSGGITIQSTPNGPRVVIAPEGAMPVGADHPPGVMFYSGQAGELEPGELTGFVSQGDLGTVPGITLLTADMAHGIGYLSLTGGGPDGDQASAVLAAGDSAWAVDYDTATLFLAGAGVGYTFDANGGHPSGESWTALTLANSWSSYGAAFQAPIYRRLVDGMVQLSGLIAPGTVTAGTVVATLPADDRYRPAADHIYRVSAGAASATADVYVRAGGNITIQNTAGTIAWLSLSNIRFPAAE